MAKDKLTEYSATNASNDVIGDISVAEGMLPSAVNNALREQMTHLKNFSDGTDAIDALAVDNLKLDGNTISSTNTNGNITLDPDGTGDTIIASGNVGIGTAIPASKLHVNGSFRQTGATAPFEWTVNAGASDYYKLNAVGYADNLIVANSSGNVGIGTSSPQAKTEISGGIDNRLRINSTDGTTSNNYGIDFSTAGTVRGGIRYNAGNNYLAFYGYDNTERLRIDSSGIVLVGKSSTSLGTVGVAIRGGSVNGLIQATRSGGECIELNRTSSDGAIAIFTRQAVQVGNISVTGSGTTYNTTSDIRLKTDIAPIADATDKLMAMNAVTHKWKADPDADAVVGFIAQEMAEIVPEAVSKGEGEDDMWSMDYGRITPVLVAALQDANKKIAQLEQRIADMENN